jgi:hypothetical protein
MKRISLTLFTFCIISCSMLTLSSCKKDSADEQPPTTIVNSNGNGTGSGQTATISGKVSTPRGKPVGYAAVMVGSSVTHSDKDGEFSLVIPAGNQTVIIQTGKGKLFKTQVAVNLSANQSFRISDTSCVLMQVGQMAFVPGNYDRIESIIIDSLGYSAMAIQTNMFGSPSYITQFDAIFLNCTSYSLMQSPLYQNLDTFVQNGGSIYASDWAVEYLTGNGTPSPAGTGSKSNHSHTAVNAQSSCSMPMPGGFIADTSLCTVKGGSTGTIPDITINDAGMITALGNDSINIYYDLADWEIVIQFDAPFVTTMERPGYPGVVAAKADMSSYYSNAGNIVFTTFHNHPTMMVSADVITLLQYFIMNL